jgi:hypothetical protein
MLFVVSAGNTPVDAGCAPHFETVYPAAADLRVLSVGATLPDGLVWSDARLGNLGVSSSSWCCSHPLACLESNQGTWLDVVAPGGRFIPTVASSTVQGFSSHDYYEYLGCNPAGPQSYVDLDTLSAFGGTSASAAYVTGVAALLLSRKSYLYGEDVEQVLKRSAYNSHQVGIWTSDVGWGLVRAQPAMNFLEQSTLLAHWQGGGGAPNFSLAAVESTYVTRTFWGMEGVPAWGPNATVTRNCWRYRLTARFTFPVSIASPSLLKGAWVTAFGTRGWRDTTTFDYDYEVPTAALTNLDNTGVNITTFVYRFPDTLGKTAFWLPGTPSEAKVAITVAAATSYSAVGHDPTMAALSVRANPNPARGASWLRMNIPQRGMVRFRIYDAAGRVVKRFADEIVDPGQYRMRWDGIGDSGAPCPAGLYFLRLEQGATIAAGSVVLLKAGR